MDTPKIIIYMSCYNHEKYVREAMDSIINQTYTNWELYMVNDGSTDKTGEILSTYKDERIHYFDFKENTAFIGAANFLQNLVKDIDAQYITTFSSDDKWELDKLQRQVEILSTHPEYKCCFTWDKVIFDTDDKSYENCAEYSHVPNMSRFDWLKFYFKVGNAMNACSALMDKKVFYEIGRMNENYRQIGDYRMWIKLALKYPFYVLEEEKTYYRRHEGNLSKRNKEMYTREINESYYIMREWFHSIDVETFRRTFYASLIYSKIKSKNEFLADKFIILLNSPEHMHEQAAIEIYLENCEEQDFLDELEKRYNYKPKDFVSLTGKGGLVNYSFDLILGDKKEVLDKHNFSPAFVFLNAFGKDVVNAETFSDYTYSALSDMLISYVPSNVISAGLFDKVYMEILKFRDLRISGRSKKKIVFMIGEDSSFELASDLSEIIGNAENECYLSIIPKTESMFDLNKKIETEHELDIPDVKYINLYDDVQHCLKFTDEIGVEPDIMYYIDCIGEEYACGTMIDGYPLSVKNIYVSRKEQYEKLTERGDTVMKLFDESYAY